MGIAGVVGEAGLRDGHGLGPNESGLSSSLFEHSSVFDG
jgi:hypothetical protein